MTHLAGEEAAGAADTLMTVIMGGHGMTHLAGGRLRMLRTQLMTVIMGGQWALNDSPRRWAGCGCCGHS